MREIQKREHNLSNPLHDETSIDTMQAFQHKKRCWASEAVATSNDRKFWAFGRISLKTRGPWRHFMNCLQTSQHDLSVKYGEHASHLSVLTGGKRGEFLMEFLEPITTDIAWEEFQRDDDIVEFFAHRRNYRHLVSNKSLHFLPSIRSWINS